MNVSNLLSQKKHALVTIREDQSMCKAISLMNEKRIGALLVLDANNKLCGIVTERDVLQKTHSVPTDVCSVIIKDAMTPRAKMLIASESDPVQKVMEIMTENRIRHLPVMKDEELCGIISIGDVVKSLLDAAMVENESMKQYITGDI